MDIPPPSNRRSRNPVADKVKALQVGDAPIELRNEQDVNCAYWAARRWGYKLVVRVYEGKWCHKSSAENVGLWRAWRVA